MIENKKKMGGGESCKTYIERQQWQKVVKKGAALKTH